MGLAEGVNRVRRRLLTEWFNLEPIVEPPLPRADWNLITPTKQTTDAAETDDEARLRVLSLNIWGLPVAPHCTERAAEIGNVIDGKFDVVVLQEVWHRRERNLIIARAEKAGFHFYHYFQPAVGFPIPFGPDSFGTGLLVLSRYPIASALYHSFALTGRPYALHEADFIANKGVGLLRIQAPRGEIDLYVTHLLANYNDLGAPGPGDRYLAHRVAQSYELERFIEATNRNELTLVCGDFNSPPDCVVLRIPRELRQLRDAFTDMNNHDGLTFATEDNKFSHGEHPMRMDYILYKRTRAGAPTPTDPNHKGWHLVGSDVYKSFFTNARGEQCPLSDHFGVTAEFAFGPMHKLVKPCKSSQAKTNGDDAGLSVMLKPGCATTTCIHCDALDAKTQAKANKLGPDGLSTVERCLQDVQHSLLQGRADAAHCRVSSLRRSGFSFFAAIALVITHLCAIYLSEWVWVVALLLLFYSVVEYVLAFFFVTLECSTFTELASQVRLHLHAEHAQNNASPHAL